MDALHYNYIMNYLGWNNKKAAEMLGVCERTAWLYSQAGASGPAARLLLAYAFMPEAEALMDERNIIAGETEEAFFNRRVYLSQLDTR